jgi:hypothetical protein
MKANLLPCLSLVSLFLSFALGLADIPALAGAAAQTSSSTESKIEVVKMREIRELKVGGAPALALVSP